MSFEIWCGGRENGAWLGLSHCLDKRDHPRHRADPPSAPEACLHAGCHPARCVYGPDHGMPEPL